MNKQRALITRLLNKAKREGVACWTPKHGIVSLEKYLKYQERKKKK